MRLFILLLFLVNMASAAGTLYYGPEVFMHPDADVEWNDKLPLKVQGLHLIYSKNPKRSTDGNIRFCCFQNFALHPILGIKIIEVTVDCKFTEKPPVFIVKKEEPDWIECADPLLRVEFKELPFGTENLSAELCTENTVHFALPFVGGKDPHLCVHVESHKAKVMFDFGPDNKQSATINFLEMATTHPTPVVKEHFSQEDEDLFRNMFANKTSTKRTLVPEKKWQQIVVHNPLLQKDKDFFERVFAD